MATVLSVLAGAWIREAELIGYAVQLSESVPVIPAVAVLVLATVLNPILTRISPRLSLHRSEILVIFAIVSVTPLFSSIGMMRMLLPMMVAAQHYQTPENQLALVWERLPRWFGPRSESVIDAAFAGHAQRVPWEAWLPGLLVWGCFAGALYLALLALSAIFRKQWTERERLTFPLMQVVEELAPPEGSGVAPLLRNQFFWMGAALPLLYNLVQMTHAWMPTFPQLGRELNIGAGLEARPWSALRPLSIAWRPELVGLGYLMSTEVTFSIWVSYLALRCSRVVAAAAGLVDVTAPFPYDQSQSMGAFVALTLVSLYLGRAALREVWANFLGRGERFDDQAEPLPYRQALLLLGGSGVFILFVCLQAGMGLTLAVLYFFFVFAVALVYSRIRAETGAPMIWLFPFWQQEKMIYSLFGSSPFLVGGNAQPLVVLASFTWISRGYYPNSIMASQLESFRLAETSGTPRRQMTWALLYAGVLGFAVAAWVHLSTYYALGADYAENGGGRAKLMNQGYLAVAQILSGQARRPHLGETGAGLFGLLFTLGLVAARVRLVGFPLHPLGYAMASAYGAPIWGSALIVWALKKLILRAGGIRLYRRLIPAFMGLVLGHFFAAGVVWGTLAIFFPKVTQNYIVYFG
ncbi:MAG: hypothetical protein IT204_03255 [Fimbriimonadaceae bacterium]|nr:hypothetical protein [Fimbriimonadaceae bacterium]